MPKSDPYNCTTPIRYGSSLDLMNRLKYDYSKRSFILKISITYVFHTKIRIIQGGIYIMDLKQLSYFNVICEEKSLTKASARLHIAQPHLSHLLKTLEEELKVTLIERSTRKFKLTEAGERLHHRSMQMIELMDSTTRELKDFNEGIIGTLSIGTIHTSGDMLLPQKIHDFHLKYPDVNFDIRECGSDEITELLKNGMIEIGIIRIPMVSKTFDSICMPMEPMVAVTGKPGFFGSESTIELSRLAVSPLLVHRRYEQIIREAFLKRGLEPRILCKIEDTKSILVYARTGIGIAIIPRDWVNAIPGLNLDFREIEEPSLETGTSIIWMDEHLSPAGRHFLETFK
jgi:LysR family transcriptional regulator, salicylic acid-responsive activator of bsdBCD